jgi:hypothetical protein
MKWTASNKIALTVLCVLQLGDALSTMAATSVPGVSELNPLIDRASGKYGLGGLILAKLVAVAICIVVVLRVSRMWLVWTTVGLYVAVVSSNFLLAYR